MYFIIGTIIATILVAVFLAILNLREECVPRSMRYEPLGTSFYLVIAGYGWPVSIPVAILGGITYYIVSQIVKTKGGK